MSGTIWEVHLQLQEQVRLVLLAVDAGRDVGDQVGEKIPKSLSHFSAKETTFIAILICELPP